MVKTRRFRNKKKVRRSRRRTRRRTRRGGDAFSVRCGSARFVGTKPIRPILLNKHKERCVNKNDLRGRSNAVCCSLDELVKSFWKKA